MSGWPSQKRRVEIETASLGLRALVSIVMPGSMTSVPSTLKPALFRARQAHGARHGRPCLRQDLVSNAARLTETLRPHVLDGLFRTGGSIGSSVRRPYA